MTSTSILPWFGRLTQLVRPGRPWVRPDLHTLGAHPDRLPPFVQASVVAQRYLDLLSPLAWDRFPERNLAWRPAPVPYAALAAACLIKLDQQIYVAILTRLSTGHGAEDAYIAGTVLGGNA